MAHCWAYDCVKDWLMHDENEVFDDLLEVTEPDEIDRDGKEAIKYGTTFRYAGRKGSIQWWEDMLWKQVDADHFIETDHYEKQAPEIKWEN